MQAFLTCLKHTAGIHEMDACTVITRSAVQRVFFLGLVVLVEGSLFVTPLKEDSEDYGIHCSRRIILKSKHLGLI